MCPRMALKRDYAQKSGGQFDTAAMLEKGTLAPEVGWKLGVSRQVA